MTGSEHTASRKKIWLSSPQMGGTEELFVKEAFDTNSVAQLGPNVNGFEKDTVRFSGCGHAAAMNSGTGAIHLALSLLGISSRDFVFYQSFTFSASANPIHYLGALPFFVNSEEETWNMCQIAMEQAIICSQNGEFSKLFPKLNLPVSGTLPKAIIIYDLYCMTAKLSEICEIAGKYGIPVIKDSVEALGSLRINEKLFSNILFVIRPKIADNPCTRIKITNNNFIRKL